MICEIKTTAKKYEFTPNIISVKRGEHVKLVVTAVDRATLIPVQPGAITPKRKQVSNR